MKDFFEIIVGWINEEMDKLAYNADTTEANGDYMGSLQATNERRVYRRIRRITQEAIEDNMTIQAYLHELVLQHDLYKAYANDAAKHGEDDAFMWLDRAQTCYLILTDINLMANDWIKRAV